MPSWLPDLASEDFSAIAAEHSPLVAELIAVTWPAPVGTVYYCSTQADEVMDGSAIPVSPVEVRFEANQFMDLSLEDGVSDSRVDLDFWDGDGVIADLFQEHGPGHRVEVFYWFPEHNELISQWHGHLEEPDKEDGERFKIAAAYGFRSSLLPLPRRNFYAGCQAIFPPEHGLNTQAEIDANDCPYNRHISGGTTGNLDPETGEPYTSCPRSDRTVCEARIGDDLSFLGFDTVLESYPNAKLISITRGNENNLKRPLRVVNGPYKVKDLDLIGFSVDENTNKPDKGWLQALFACAEGENEYGEDFEINGTLVADDQWEFKSGARRQSVTFFSPNVGNYSGTVLARGRIQGDFRTTSGSEISGVITLGPRTNIRIWTDETTWTEGATDNRAWFMFDAIRDKRWGHGIDPSRLVVADWIALADWCAETVGFKFADGSDGSTVRSTFIGELLDKTAQEHIFQMGLPARIVLFPFRGKTRAMALTNATTEELDAAPVFTDAGENRNILLEDESNEASRSSLETWKTNDRELANRWVVTFKDKDLDNSERPLIFEDVEQQLKAGIAYGDKSRRVIEKKADLLGVDTVGQAILAGQRLLDLGKYDGTTDEGGGLLNNRRIRFLAWFKDCLSLHKYKIIRVNSPKLTRYSFTHWRIVSITRKADLKVEIEAQAYAEVEELPPASSGNLEAVLSMKTNGYSTGHEADLAATGIVLDAQYYNGTSWEAIEWLCTDSAYITTGAGGSSVLFGASFPSSPPTMPVSVQRLTAIGHRYRWKVGTPWSIQDIRVVADVAKYVDPASTALCGTLNVPANSTTIGLWRTSPMTPGEAYISALGTPYGPAPSPNSGGPYAWDGDTVFEVRRAENALEFYLDGSLVFTANTTWPTSTSGSGGGTTITPTPQPFSDTEPLLFDERWRPLADAGTGVYVAFAPTDAEDWSGATLYADRGDGYEVIATTDTAATLGVAATVLEDE